jgi:hypothetical protein
MVTLLSKLQVHSNTCNKFIPGTLQPHPICEHVCMCMRKHVHYHDKMYHVNVRDLNKMYTLHHVLILSP